MLKSIDVLIGLTVVMLVGSLAAMLITQVLIELGQLRSRHLRAGLTDLVVQLHPATTRADAERIATAVLKHRLVRVSDTRMGTVVRREDLVTFLMEMAAPAPAGREDGLSDGARTALNTLLRENGITDPAGALARVRMLALDLERDFPEAGASARHTLALATAARSELVAKTSAWFDQTMDRVTERFTAVTRGLTFAAAVIVVVVTQLDTLQLVNRLSLDDHTRQMLVVAASAATGDGAGATASTPEHVQRMREAIDDSGVVHIAATYQEWWWHWRDANIGGILLSLALLSLGAPFWFKMLSNLLKLRSVLAQKDDEDRDVRQKDGTPSLSGFAAAAARLAALSPPASGSGGA
jgi:hypothetical protein